MFPEKVLLFGYERDVKNLLGYSFSSYNYKELFTILIYIQINSQYNMILLIILSVKYITNDLHQLIIISQSIIITAN